MTSYYHAGMEHIRAQSARYGSAPTRERDSDQLSPIARAAWYVEDAFSGNFEEDMDARTNAQRDAYVRYESLVHPERLVCVVALALVSLIEVPLWCLQGRNNLLWVGGSKATGKEEIIQQYLMDARCSRVWWSLAKFTSARIVSSGPILLCSQTYLIMPLRSVRLHGS